MHIPAPDRSIDETEWRTFIEAHAFGQPEFPVSLARTNIHIEPDGVGRPLAANLSYFRQAQPPDPLALQFGRHGHRK